MIATFHLDCKPWPVAADGLHLLRVEGHSSEVKNASSVSVQAKVAFSALHTWSTKASKCKVLI